MLDLSYSAIYMYSTSGDFSQPNTFIKVLGGGSLEIGQFIQVALVRDLGYRTPDLPGPVLVGLIVNLGLQDDMLAHVADALAALNLGAALGIVVARYPLHTGDAHDGLLQGPHGPGRARDDGDAPVGQAGVVPGLVIFH